MGKYTKYKLYQKYETRGSQEAIPVYPNTYSIDGDGTMPLVIVEENSRDCGYTGDTQPIYRWYNMPIDKYYVCDECAANFKIKAVYTGGTTYSAACDNSTELTSADTKPSGYQYAAMSSVTIGSCVTSIADYAFMYCSNLVRVNNDGEYNGYFIPEGITSIGINAFHQAKPVSDIVIPDSVTTIGYGAFNLVGAGHVPGYIEIGTGITSIGNNAFSKNILWQGGVVTIKATTPPTIQSHTFDFGDDGGVGKIRVPAQSVDTYKNAGGGWSYYRDRIIAIST